MSVWYKEKKNEIPNSIIVQNLKENNVKSFQAPEIFKLVHC